VQSASPQSVPPPAASPSSEKSDTVIAIFEDGVKMTAGEFQTLLQANPAWQGQDRALVLHKYAVLRKAAALARSRKLDEKSPYKEALEFSTMVTLAGFASTDALNSLNIGDAEIETFYNEHKEPFKQIKVSGIKVAFGGAAPPEDNSSTVMASRAPRKSLTEEEAKAKAEKLVAQIRAGADFARLVQLESDDETSKPKGGELGTWRVTDNVPDAMRAAVFTLKEGEVSDPVRQTGGFYIFHADSVAYTPLSQVRDTIYAQLRQMHAAEWLHDIDSNTKVQFPASQEPAPPGASPSGQADSGQAKQ
jgi:peptidyl-prolyl cis-trans isomerase C